MVVILYADVHKKPTDVHKGKAVEKAWIHCTGARHIYHRVITEKADGFISWPGQNDSVELVGKKKKYIYTFSIDPLKNSVFKHFLKFQMVT